MQDLQVLASIFAVMLVCYWRTHLATMHRYRGQVPSL
ncbi:LAMI_0G12277g1_1 [Lachancea mirantina]|uniref:LAMI_0G12277g1_1 n=1 Tax=Lachancea mirantina TaxID=1230905 RepID=A0A1G4KBJ7_9SACH|nr:LAMI_0G12277g1_1 [Lachancea mirantina]